MHQKQYKRKPGRKKIHTPFPHFIYFFVRRPPLLQYFFGGPLSLLTYFLLGPLPYTLCASKTPPRLNVYAWKESNPQDGLQSVNYSYKN